MGCRQAVRPTTLTRIFAGSNPASPVLDAYSKYDEFYNASIKENEMRV